MSRQEYIFEDAYAQAEWVRLKAIEAVFDPSTKVRLESTGLAKGWRCLEIGPGAGSIMRWLGEKAGPEGRVTAVEMNPRFLDAGDLPPYIELVKGDIRDVNFENSRFDLIHSRYVLIHLSNYRPVLEKLLKALKPGGRLVIEEPDFSASRPIIGPKHLCRSFKRVNRAIYRMYRDLHINHDAGLKFLTALHALGASALTAENDAPLARGGSGVARMMCLSAKHLREKYLATKEVSGEDIDAYCAFAENPDTWAVYYATIAVSAQSPL